MHDIVSLSHVNFPENGDYSKDPVAEMVAQALCGSWVIDKLESKRQSKCIKQTFHGQKSLGRFFSSRNKDLYFFVYLIVSPSSA